MRKRDSLFCDDQCNSCPVINHGNSRLLSLIMNAMYNRFGDGVREILNTFCPDLTCCADCRGDDFSHTKGCEIFDCADTYEWLGQRRLSAIQYVQWKKGWCNDCKGKLDIRGRYLCSKCRDKDRMMTAEGQTPTRGYRRKAKLETGN